MNPRLSRSQVEKLIEYQQEGIEPDEVYGRPIGSVTGAYGSEWLEAGVMAGHAPHLDALELVMRANHLWVSAEVQESRAQGADGDAVGWLESTAQEYRRLVAVLEELVEDFETRLARDWRREPPSDDQQIRALWTEHAAAAERRSRTAAGRRESALKDVRDLQQLNTRWRGGA